jgi:Icc-related predicted phosphoesterase
MAFRSKGNASKIWSSIPLDTEILITHIPPYGILDGKEGCSSLLERVKEVKPRFHIFGHIHQWNGFKKMEETTFINCSCEWEPLHAPYYFDYEIFEFSKESQTIQ